MTCQIGAKAEGVRRKQRRRRNAKKARNRKKKKDIRVVVNRRGSVIRSVN